MHKLVLTAAAGAAGTLCRLGMSRAVQHLGGPDFPYGTFSVNMLGCFLFGLVWTMAEEHVPHASAEVRLVLLTGFMGAFTTFSTFAFETCTLLRQGQWLHVAANAGGQLALGVALAAAGMALAKAL